MSDRTLRLWQAHMFIILGRFGYTKFYSLYMPLGHNFARGEKPPNTFIVGEALGEFSEGTSSQLTLQPSRTFFCRRWTFVEVTSSLLAADLPVNPDNWAPFVRRHRLPTHRFTQLPFAHYSAGIWLATAVVASVCVLNFDLLSKRSENKCRLYTYSIRRIEKFYETFQWQRNENFLLIYRLRVNCKTEMKFF